MDAHAFTNVFKSIHNLHISVEGKQTRTAILSHLPTVLSMSRAFCKNRLSHPFGMLRASIFLSSHSPFFFFLRPFLPHPPILLAETLAFVGFETERERKTMSARGGGLVT